MRFECEWLDKHEAWPLWTLPVLDPHNLLDKHEIHGGYARNGCACAEKAELGALPWASGSTSKIRCGYFCVEEQAKVLQAVWIRAQHGAPDKRSPTRSQPHRACLKNSVLISAFAWNRSLFLC